MGLFHFGPGKRQLGGAHIQQWSKFIDVFITISLEGDEGGNVEGGGGDLGGERGGTSQEVVVAVDEHAGGLFRDGLGEGFDGEVREWETDRALDMAEGEFVGAAGVEHDCFRFCRHFQELGFRKAMRFTGVPGRPCGGHEALEIDEFIGNRIGGLEGQMEAEQGEDDGGGVLKFVHVARIILRAPECVRAW